MAYPRTILIAALVLLAACNDKSNDETTDPGTTGSSDTSGSMPTTSTASDTSSGDAPTSSTSTDPGDASSGGSTSGSSTDSTTASTAASTTDSTTASTTDSTTGAPLCSLEQAATDLAASNGEFEDCGTVTPWDDDTAAWQAAHDCAVAAAKEQRAFKVVTWLQGIDSEFGEAYASLLGRSYGITRFQFDSDPCGGGGCGPVLHAATCEALVPVEDCTVAPGNACLTCVGAGASSQVCGPE